MHLNMGPGGEPSGVRVGAPRVEGTLAARPSPAVLLTQQVEIFLSHWEVIVCSTYEIHIICVWPPLPF